MMQPRPSTRGTVLSLLEQMGQGDAPAESPNSSPVTLAGTSPATLSRPGPDDEVGEKKFVDYFQTPWPYPTVGKSTTELDKVIVDGHSHGHGDGDGDDAVVLATVHNTAALPTLSTRRRLQSA